MFDFYSLWSTSAGEFLMKNILVPFLLILCTGTLTGCATTRNLGNDATAVFDDPMTSGIALATVGGVIDHVVFGGKGTAGAIIGGAVGYSVGKNHQERKLLVHADGTVTVRCQNGYTFNSRSGTARMDKVCSGTSIEHMPASGFPEAPIASYGARVGERIAVPATTCHRYTVAGVNPNC